MWSFFLLVCKSVIRRGFFFLLISRPCAKNDDLNHELPHWLQAKLLGGHYPGMKREPKAAWLWLQSFRSKSATLSTALTSVHSTSPPWYHMHNPRLKAPSHPQGKPNKLVKTKTETYLNRPSFWLPAKQQLCHSQCGSSIYPPLLITDVWPKPLALMLCERSGRTYQCHATPGQQQPAMATPSQKQLKRRSQ